MKLNKNAGFTLIEVVASIVIITLLLTGFMSLLLASARTTQTSQNVIDYTLIAQTEYELLYKFAQERPKTQQNEVLIDEMGYMKEEEGSESTIFVKETTEAEIRLTVSPYTENLALDDRLSKVVIEAIPVQVGSGGSQIESVIEWRKTP
ncbi:prepilin-type N-terminal cleavage/methylation domain-containing protein [Pseudoalteromonas gelatinilytica]|uniref:Prepilin-type N-terminal cleavage/methylation domain-containing protein n=1 Tax=Pseudoalteromonas gelatinilytica TaxID=1703256 RepID=A0A3A3EIV6_9GAMM|nr:prepilin-type N-terminal cleavage/methylation domain-containing protein [Pseudoalteromonas profundi]RJF32064.1 prepilin-type N-terminal cleavage/methylation domain-containing protein [Pseudoalteromonas profundi]